MMCPIHQTRKDVVSVPQLNPGGKFVFGRSVLQENGSLRLPPQAVEEYRITEEGQVILFTGSKSTGGFCVTRRGLLLPSKLGRILTDCSGLGDGSLPPARLLAYKGSPSLQRGSCPSLRG